MNIMRASPTQLFEYGPFTIRRMRPGEIDPAANSSAFGPLAIVDHMQLKSGARIAMHQHVNDEILHYVWRGSLFHEDRSGERTPLSTKKVMLISAGEGTEHEESAPVVETEMLQIFIRPEEAGGEGRVQFMTRPQGIAEDRWTLLAGPEGEAAPLTLRQRVWAWDIRLAKQAITKAPWHAGLAQWLYVAEGTITVGGERLGKGDALSDGLNPLPPIEASRDAILVCLQVDLQAQATLAGHISGH
ncbi:pirin family protein [Mixta intestinalis]|uniref:Quercetin 2,3-dioxygenase n=1 Tax=Mixta intestinalis TaxID=1615494 RepID=A0A6P1PVJ3_9GAMM|nr:pirin family protein [Mixta intestinalis]QHM70064.1 Quercetin 2,3-dioxygenase [Mixta intestinalis]